MFKHNSTQEPLDPNRYYDKETGEALVDQIGSNSVVAVTKTEFDSTVTYRSKFFAYLDLNSLNNLKGKISRVDLGTFILMCNDLDFNCVLMTKNRDLHTAKSIASEMNVDYETIRLIVNRLITLGVLKKVLAPHIDKRKKD